jgi:hypothetical protein
MAIAVNDKFPRHVNTKKELSQVKTNQVKGSVVLLNFVSRVWLKKTQLNVFQYANFTVVLDPNMGVVFVKSVNYGSQLSDCEFFKGVTTK